MIPEHFQIREPDGFRPGGGWLAPMAALPLRFFSGA